MRFRDHRFCKRLAAPLVLGALLVSGLLPSAAAADFGISAFDGQVNDPSGDAYTQASGHPFSASTSIVFNTHPDPEYGIFQIPDADPRNLYVDLPPGLVGNPTVAGKCSLADFFAGEGLTTCLPATQVGLATLTATLRPSPAVLPIYSLVPPPGVPASFGFMFGGVPVFLSARVRSDGDYGLSIDSEGTSQGMQLTSVAVELWGTPADPVHDEQRCRGISEASFTCTGTPGDPERGPNPAGVPPRPFLTNPSACTPSGAGLRTTLRTDSWADPGAFVEVSFLSHRPPGHPLPPSEWGPEQGPTGCERVPFSPRVEIRPTSTEAESPTGLDFEISVPTGGLLSAAGLAQSALKKTDVTLPAGMTVNAASANGLGGCTPAQFAAETARSGPGAGCPDDSKIGSVAIDTPLLEAPLNGSVYVARQGDNPFGSLLALYLVAKSAERGVVVKLAGKVDPDPVDGRLRVSFDENPQLPFSSLKVSINSGPTAPLVNPPACGTYSARAELTPWARPGAPVGLEDSFQVATGPGGSACPASGRFEPSFEAGSVLPIGGAYSPLVVNLSRPAGSQPLRALSVDLPEGLAAKLAGVPYCPQSALDAAASQSGRAELSGASCPQASRVGSVDVGAGAGPMPLHVGGVAYLAGPYRGAPLSLAIVTPAVAGPFDLGTVVVRSALEVDPRTAKIRAVSDQIPQILQGVPLQVRSIGVNVDRPNFALNPTDCDASSVDGTLFGTSSSKQVASRFQVGNCAALPFKPQLTLRLKGPTKRGQYPRLSATLTQKPGQANIERVSVALPHSEFLAQEHIKTICTRVQYAAKQCPSGSVYGYAKAWTPLLDQPLQGPVYLRSSSNPLPDLVASLDGQVHLDLVGRIDSVNGGIRNTFEVVPDAPVSKFTLTMKGGKKSLLVNSRDLCKSVNRATVEMDGQNGKAHDSRPLLRNSCGKGKKRSGGKHRSR